MPCIHYNTSNACYCSLGLGLPLCIKRIYNHAKGWDYGAPGEHRDDWQASLPCVHKQTEGGLLPCPFYSSGINPRFLEKANPIPEPVILPPRSRRRNIKT